MRRLVVASNRTATPGEDRAGGLAVALSDALAERGGGVWFGWSGEIRDAEDRSLRHVSEDAIDFALADLTEAEYEGYYLGFSNRALWPVCHYRVDLARFADSDFDLYASVNSRFGRLLRPLLRDGDLVWIHDYQLLLMGQELRAEGWTGPLGFFLHIPFPPPEVWISLPQHQRLTRALAEFDLIGLQTSRDVGNFRRTLVEVDGAEELPDGRLRLHGRTIRVGAFPIGIDPAEFSRLAVSEEARTASGRVARIMGDRALVIGADRMDYSKGLPQRLQAFGRLLDDHEDLRGRVNLLQILPPSREAVGAYRDLREEIDRLAGRVNGDYSDLDYAPVRYLARSYPREALAGLYRLARVALVTPLHDGMNLVAKEYVASQDPEDPGVLILSEFAGAAEHMTDALLVNPHDIGSVADAIRAAIEMPLEERRRRWRALHEEVTTHNIAGWRRSFLNALETAAGEVA